MTNKITPNYSKTITCEQCNFKCFNKQDYTRHLSTRKHQILTNPNDKTPKVYMCDCGKSYKHASSLCGHKKKCNYKQEQTPKVDIQKEDNKDNMIDLLLENQKDMLMEKKEMKDMFIMFLKNQMESQSTQMENQNNIDSIKKVKQK